MSSTARLRRHVLHCLCAKAWGLSTSVESGSTEGQPVREHLVTRLHTLTLLDGGECDFVGSDCFPSLNGVGSRGPTPLDSQHFLWSGGGGHVRIRRKRSPPLSLPRPEGPRMRAEGSNNHEHHLKCDSVVCACDNAWAFAHPPFLRHPFRCRFHQRLPSCQ